MSALLNLIYFRFKRYLPMLSIALVIGLVLVVFYYAYNRIYLPAKDKSVFKDVGNADTNGRAVTVFMFHVDWCPHCKKALPEWDMFRDQYNGKSLNGYQIDCKAVDCTNTDDPTVKGLVDKYSLKQYPTILAVMPGSNGKENRIDYDAKVKKEYLDKFVISLTSESTA